MKYFLIKLNSLSYTVSSLDVGNIVQYSAQSSLETINYSVLEPQDFIAIYYEEPIKKVNAIWQVVGDVSEKAFSFKKVCEASIGSDLDSSYAEQLGHANLVELHENDFNKIKEKIQNHILDLLHTASTNEHLLYQKIVFGAPGTGKSYKLNKEAMETFPTACDDFLVLKGAILKAKNAPGDKIIKALKLGLQYSAVVDRIFENNDRTQEEIKADFRLTEDDFTDRQWQELIYVAKAYNNKSSILSSCIERVTFHPNYSYAQFVGTYKPVQDENDVERIIYKYVPGPFMRVYCNAKKNQNKKFLLLIEEINRANVAAVFGDVFQLLDRKNGVSEYPVTTSEDIKKYLKDNGIDDCEELKIPDNMYIWATMNSADQGVFPMDTAFKRRWEFEYIGINENEASVDSYEIPLQKKEDGSHEWTKWNELRHSINDKLTEININEDKLLGPHFISETKLKTVDGRNESNAEEFIKSFKSKVLMYLFEDVVKMRPGDLFDVSAVGKLRFSDICKKFDEIGQGIFNI